MTAKKQRDRTKGNRYEERQEDYDDNDSFVDERLEDLRREAESLFDDVGKNDRCPCSSGRKFKNCCLPLIYDRKRIMPLEDKLRSLIKEYSGRFKNEMQAGMAAYRFDDKLLMENDMECFLDWYVHDFIPPGGRQTMLERMIDGERDRLTETEIETLTSWSNSFFTMYTVLSVRRSVGYTVEDMYVDPGKKSFVADLTSSLLVRRFDIIFFRLYDFGRIKRVAAGIVSAPYRLKSEFMDVIHETWRDYAKEHGYPESLDDRQIRVRFMRDESSALLRNLMRAVDESRHHRILSQEGHEFKYCKGTLQIADGESALKTLSSRKEFLKADGDRHSFNWIDARGRIAENPDSGKGKDSRNTFLFETKLVTPGSPDPAHEKDSTVYGNVEIEGDKIVASAVSAERYGALKSLLTEIFGPNGFRMLNEEFKDLDQLRAEKEEPSESTEREDTLHSFFRESEEEPDLPADEEIADMIRDNAVVLRDFEGWLVTRSEAFDGMTPLEASGKVEMKEKLRDVLREIEYAYSDRWPFVVAVLRAKLGVYENTE